MTTSRDPHNALWTQDDRNPVTLPLIGRCGPGLRYRVHRFGEPIPPAPKSVEAPVDVRRGKADLRVRRFTPEEDSILLDAVARGIPIKKVSLQLRRCDATCAKRLRLLSKRDGGDP